MTEQLKLTIGDYFGVSHHHTETVEVTVTSHDWFALAKNYQKNVKQFGFSPTDVIERDLTLSDSAVQALTEAGMTFSDLDEEPDAERAAETDWSIVLCYDVAGDASQEPALELAVETHIVRIVMFFLGYGLENFSWHPTPVKAINLNTSLGLEGIGESFWGE